MLILGRTTRKHGSAVQKWYSQVCPGWERLSHVSYATSCMCMKKAMTTTDGSCQPGVLCPPSGKKGWASWFVQKRWPALQNQLSILSLSCFLNRCKYSMSTALILAYRARGKLFVMTAGAECLQSASNSSNEMSGRWPRDSQTNS